MAKKTTVAALALVSINKNIVTISTAGTIAAPGSKLMNWKIKWGDDDELIDIGIPALQHIHSYPVIPIDPLEPTIDKDIYDIYFEVRDNRNVVKFAGVNNVIILRNPINPPVPGPNITQLIPTTGLVGNNVTIIGTGFGATQGSSTVTFDGTPATVNSWSVSSISVVVPSIGDGTTEIIVTVNGISSSAAIYNVTSVPPPAETFDFYVAKNGNNAWNGLFPDPGTFPNGPKLTINAGIALLSAGKSLGVRAGTYVEEIISIPSGTSWNNKVRIANYNNESVLLNPNSGGSGNALRLNESAFQYIEVDGISMDGPDSGGVVVIGFDAHHIRIKNAEITNFTAPGGSGQILVRGNDCEFINLEVHGHGGPYAFYIIGDRNLIDNCDMYALSYGAVHIYNGGPTGGPPTANIVRNNRIHDIVESHYFGVPDNRTFGILVSGDNNQIYNNVIWNLDLPGAAAGQSACAQYTGSGNKWWYNTMVNCSATGGFKIDPTSSNTEIRDNIAYNNGGPTYSNSGSGTIQDHNAFAGVNPQFVNLAGNDFHLTAATPASIANAGIAIPQVTTDFDGVPRGNPPDMGAFERP